MEAGLRHATGEGADAKSMLVPILMTSRWVMERISLHYALAASYTLAGVFVAAIGSLADTPVATSIAMLSLCIVRCGNAAHELAAG